MEFRIITHTVTGKPMVEVWREGKFIASIYVHEDGYNFEPFFIDCRRALPGETGVEFFTLKPPPPVWCLSRNRAINTDSMTGGEML